MAEEHQLLEVTVAPSDCDLKMFETTANLHRFWTEVEVQYSEIATEARNSPLSYQHPFCKAGF